MTQVRPLITVLMPVYNDRALAIGAAQSMLRQTMGDLELLIVDDGSTDGSADAMRDLGDPRVRILALDRNHGITTALNAGLDSSRGEYIARMDADDISEPTRLALQIDRMQAEPELVVLGTARRVVDEQGVTIAVSQSPLDDLAIRWKLLLGSPLAHPTVMMRRDTLEKAGLRYDERFVAAEDYELWTRFLAIGRAANLPDPLVRYRLRNGISRSRRAEQLASHDRIAHRANRRFLHAFPLDERQVRHLRGRFGGYSVREPDMNPLDPEWIDIYAKMLEAFVSSYRTEVSEEALNHFADQARQVMAGMLTSAA